MEENTKQLQNTSKVTHLKCTNCGSSHFTQDKNEIFRCAYCGSTIQVESGINDKFISFADDPTQAKQNIHLIGATKTKDEFYKDALIYLSMNKNTPDDILSAKFEDVKLNYGYFVSFDVDFSVIKITDQVVSQTSTNPTSNNQDNTEQSSSFVCCTRVEKNDTNLLQRILLEDLQSEDITIDTKPISKAKIKEYNLTIPSKESIKTAMNEQIELIRKDVSSKISDKNTQIIHYVNNVELYIAPEYSLEYEYDGKKYYVSSLAYGSKIIDQVPKANTSLTKKLSKSSAIINSASIGLSLITVIFALLHLFVLKTQNFIIVDVVLLVASVITYFVTRIIHKKRIIKIKSTYFNTRRKLIEEYITNNNLPKLTDQEYTAIGEYLRWY